MAMTQILNKKLVSVYLEELQYMLFQQMAKQQNCNTADLIRDAMDSYIKQKKKKNVAFEDWAPVSLGGIKAGASDWNTKDYQDEMLGDSYDRD